MSDIVTVRTAIQTKMAAVSGIVSAPVTQPNQIDEADMPLSLVFIGPGTWGHDTVGPAGQKQERTFIVNVYVAPIVTGVPGEKYELAETLLQAVGMAFVSDRTMDATSGVLIVDNIQDGGVRGDIMFGGVAYMGFSFSLTPHWIEG